MIYNIVINDLKSIYYISYYYILLYNSVYIIIMVNTTKMSNAPRKNIILYFWLLKYLYLHVSLIQTLIIMIIITTFIYKN